MNEMREKEEEVREVERERAMAMAQETVEQMQKQYGIEIACHFYSLISSVSRLLKFRSLIKN